MPTNEANGKDTSLKWDVFITPSLIMALSIIPLVITPTVAFATTWRYDAGFLQGVSGGELEAHHTQEFMSGYLKGLQTYWFNRGYAEGNNKLPTSSTNVNYTNGYNEATQEVDQFGNLGKIPIHNQNDFYLGIWQGYLASDDDHGTAMNTHTHDSCPLGHTAEYCTGYDLGYARTSYELDQD